MYKAPDRMGTFQKDALIIVKEFEENLESTSVTLLGQLLALSQNEQNRSLYIPVWITSSLLPVCLAIIIQASPLGSVSDPPMLLFKKYMPALNMLTERHILKGT